RRYERPKVTTRTRKFANRSRDGRRVARRAAAALSALAWRTASLNILRLFAHLLAQQLQVHGSPRHVPVAGLGTHRVGLAVHFLEQEVQAFAGATAAAALVGRLGFFRTGGVRRA